MHPQAGLVSDGRAVLHGQHHVVNFSFFDRQRLQHAEEGHGAGDVGEQVEVEAAAADRANDPPHLLLFMPLFAQPLRQLEEALGDRRIEIFIEIDKLRIITITLWPLPRSSTKPLPSTKLSISSVCLSTELRNDLCTMGKW